MADTTTKTETEITVKATKIETEITVKATAMHGTPMFLRQQGVATAEFDGGGRVEIATNVGDGSLLVSLHPSGEKHWTTYVLTPRALIDAVLAAEKR